MITYHNLHIRRYIVQRRCYQNIQFRSFHQAKMFTNQIVTILFISSILIIMTHGRSLFNFSHEDDRLNEVSAEYDRKIVIPRLDRLFSSAEVPSRRSRKYDQLRSNRNDKREATETTDSSKHAHSMITSMISFVSSVVNLGRSFMRNE